MTTAGAGESSSGVAKMGLSEGQIVQEIGWYSDVDEDLRHDIMDEVDADLLEDPLEAVDVVLLWWREDDGDVVDGLLESLRSLSDTGVVWLLTPKIGTEGYVDPADIAEAASTAGLSLTSTESVSSGWTATKLVRPKSGRKNG
ncbi:DUF3052 domain-containing protein [Parenemella sanctibonifatiensis]